MNSDLQRYRILIQDCRAEKVKNLFQPKPDKKLPNVFLEEEVTALLRSVDNPKHRCTLMLIYSAGLRLGELTNLKLTDIQADEHRIFVRDGKGKKDRCTILAGETEQMLRTYLVLFKPVHWLFEGADGGAIAIAAYKQFLQRQKNVPESILWLPHILCDTLSPHIYWRKGSICGIFRTSWVMKAAKPPKYTPTSPKKVGTR